MKSEDKLPAEIGVGLALGVIVAALVFLMLSWLLVQLPWFVNISDYGDQLRYWLAMTLNSLISPLFQESADRYRQFLGHLPPGVSPWMVTLRFDLPAIVGIAAGSFSGFLVGSPVSAIRHVSGRRLFEGKFAHKTIRPSASNECKNSGDGLQLHPTFPWRLSLDRESRHFMVLGSVGGGKTQIINSLLGAAIERGDRVVIYDNKGDFTSWLPYLVLFAPWDARSHVWDIAKDCHNSQDARELASRLIPTGHDPMWHQAARQILTALIIKLQCEQPGAWTWRTLSDLICQSQEELLATVKQYMPEARHTIEAPGKTTQSILVNFSASLGFVADLGAAWGKAAENRRFSFTQWLNDPADRRRVLVLQGSGRYAELARSYIQSVITLISSQINSPEFTESRERRLWLFLDEFPKLGELKDFAPLLEIGRSKGVRIVLGAQDISQIKQIYGQNTADSWTSMVGTQIIVRVNAGETPNFIAKNVVGSRTIDRTVIHNGTREAPKREYPLVIEPSELSGDLGADETGVKALLLGYGDAFILKWPFTNPPKKREASVPAPWLKPPPPLKQIGAGQAENLTPTSEKQNTEGIVTPSAPRLRLHQTNDNPLMISDTATPVSDSAEPLAEMTDTSAGGSHDPR